MNFVQKLYNSFKKHSDKNAFCIDDTFYTYSDLLQVITKIRKEISSTTILDDKHFGLVLNNDLETYATIFALWMEGKAYVPINPVAPKNRNIEILESIDVTYVFDSNKVSDFTSFKIINPNVLHFDTENLLSAPIKFNEESIAYVLFTSGSTGTPKGIPISFKNLNTLITELDIDEEYKLKPTDKCLQMYDLTFDASLTALLPALLSGACAYTVPSNAIKYLYIFKLMHKYKLTVLKMVPSIIYYLRPYFSEINVETVRYCIFGGEKLYEDVLKDWSKCIPNSKILNHYGPTEFTVCSGYYSYKFDTVNKSHNGVLSIGKPFKNVDYIIVDYNNNMSPTGVEGELCLSGNQLTSGYWKNEKLNKTSFFIKENETGISKRFYKTGDICFKDRDGYYMYVGRKDFQVKIGGYRVELGEIEYHARAHTSTNSKNLAVLDINTSAEKNELVLIIEGDEFDTQYLQEYLNGKLADYMIPKKVIFTTGFPYNNNGKLDRRKLKKMIESNI